MFDDTLNSFDENATEKLVCRFEEMLRQNAAYFFDVEEFEGIIDYYADRRNWSRARKAVKYGLNIYPTSSQLQLRWAQALTAQGSFKHALKILKRLELIEPMNGEVFLAEANIHRQLNDHDHASLYFKKAIELSDNCEDDVYYDLALEQENCNDFKGAIESLQAALNLNPENEAALFELSHCFDHTNQIQEGIEFLQAYVDNHPYSTIGWYNLGNCLSRLDRNEEAITAFDYTTVIDATFAPGYFAAGNLYAQIEQYDKAITTYSEAVEAGYDKALAYCYMGECYEHLERLTEATEFYQKALECDDQMADAYIGMGMVKELEDRMKEAIGFFEEALKIEPDNADYLHIMGEAFGKSGQSTRAIEIYERLLEKQPDDEEAWVKYGKLLSETLSPAAAAEVLQDALKGMPHSATLLYAMVAFLLQDKRLSEAEGYLTIALETNYDAHREFLQEWPDATRFPNIARLIELFKF